MMFHYYYYYYYYFTREFGTKCAACGHSLEASDWVRYARDFVFHLNCFTCSICGVTLSTGEEFLMSGNRPFCRTHGFMEMHNGKENMDSASGKDNIRLWRWTVLSEYSLSVWRNFSSSASQNAQREESDQSVQSDSSLNKHVRLYVSDVAAHWFSPLRWNAFNFTSSRYKLLADFFLIFSSYWKELNKSSW